MIFNESTKSEPKRGSPDGDQMAGMALFLLVGIVALAMLVAVLPILVGGSLIALTCYGALMEETESNGEKLFWAVLVTLVGFVYLFGFFPPFDHYYRGILFTDFAQWTWQHIQALLDTVNDLLPRKFLIHRIVEQEVRIYFWSVVPVAIAFFTMLHFKGAGRGIFIYQGLNLLCTPFRMMASRWQWLVGVASCLAGLTLGLKMPEWLRYGSVITLSLLTLYHLMTMRSGEKARTTDHREGHAGPIVVGSQKGRPGVRAMVTEDQLNHHVHIVGASGFGKSVLLSHIIKNRIHSGSGLLFVDLKADFETIRQVVSVAKAAERVDDLYIFSCGNPEISSPYNVVAEGSANQLKDRIMGALNWSEEFYKNEASSFLLKLLRGLTLLRDLNIRPFDLGTILKCTEDPKEIASLLNSLPDSEAEVKAQLQGLVGHLARQDNHRALQGLRSQLESLIYSDFGHLLKANTTGIDLFEAIRSQKIVYVLLDSRTYGESSKALGKLILQDLKAASARIDNEIQRAERTPFTVVVDEFADMASEDFVGFLDRARSSKIGVVVAHQEIADLSRISPEFANRLMNSTSNLFAFLQKIPTSSELVSGICGTQKTKEVTEQAKSNWLFGDEKTGMKSIKEVDEFVVHPNVIRSLPVGECVLVQKYPKSKAMIVRVRAETKDYLSKVEVELVLRKMKTRHRDAMVSNSFAKPSPILGSDPSANGNGSDGYWNEKADLS